MANTLLITTTPQQQDDNKTTTTGINENIQEPKRDMPETFANESAMNLLAEQLQEANNQIKTKDTQIDKLQQALDQHNFTQSPKKPSRPKDFRSKKRNAPNLY